MNIGRQFVLCSSNQGERNIYCVAEVCTGYCLLLLCFYDYGRYCYTFASPWPHLLHIWITWIDLWKIILSLIRIYFSSESSWLLLAQVSLSWTMWAGLWIKSSYSVVTFVSYLYNSSIYLLSSKNVFTFINCLKHLSVDARRAVWQDCCLRKPNLIVIQHFVVL